ncbi:hypothetical protein K431DRAFT_285331 [Polychaeton citri CBS 116435]|uniref:Zn(2)-C6 fungal-type domain-containing protein n=1 Tax=Polychaeton citri CBS 116435 TaxID=1314669 RepID=A0A9P4Q7A8_9PEZI|nr:hypothetical protein K431DRAFT_285331 [Polychaeton citri CBS 116435]
MVNKAPSKGCDRCRARHVKCDEAKPKCSKCALKDFECNYRDANGWVFKDQSAAIVRKQSRKPIVAQQRAPALNRYQRNESVAVKIEPVVAEGAVLVQAWELGPVEYGQDAIKSRFVTPEEPDRVYKMHDSHQQRSQILYSAMNMPKGASWLFRNGSLSLLPTLDLSTSLVQAAIDALCFSELGKTFNDTHCSHLGAVRLTDALSLLKFEVAHPLPGRKPEGATHRQRLVFASIMLLAFREVGEAFVTRQGEDAWLAHIRGAQYYARAVGPDIVSTPFDTLLITDLRASSFAPEITARKADVWSDPAWVRLCKSPSENGVVSSPRGHDSRIAPTDDQQELDFLVYSDTGRVPSFLEYGDKILYERDHLGAVEAFHSLKAMYDDLEGWTRVQCTSDPHKYWYNIVPVETYPKFATSCSNDLFKTAYHFSEARAIFRCTTLWVGSYVVGELAISLYDMVTELGDQSMLSDVDIEDFKRRLYTTATHLARSIPFVFDTELTATGGLAEYRLGLAEKHFDEYGMLEESKWVAAVREILPLPALKRRTSVTQR